MKTTFLCKDHRKVVHHAWKMLSVNSTEIEILSGFPLNTVQEDISALASERSAARLAHDDWRKLHQFLLLVSFEQNVGRLEKGSWIRLKPSKHILRRQLNQKYASSNLPIGRLFLPGSARILDVHIDIRGEHPGHEPGYLVSLFC